jgi:hypothetical protein
MLSNESLVALKKVAWNNQTLNHDVVMVDKMLQEVMSTMSQKLMVGFVNVMNDGCDGLVDLEDVDFVINSIKSPIRLFSGESALDTMEGLIIWDNKFLECFMKKYPKKFRFLGKPLRFEFNFLLNAF